MVHPPPPSPSHAQRRRLHCVIDGAKNVDAVLRSRLMRRNERPVGSHLPVLGRHPAMRMSRSRFGSIVLSFCCLEDFSITARSFPFAHPLLPNDFLDILDPSSSNKSLRCPGTSAPLDFTLIVSVDKSLLQTWQSFIPNECWSLSSESQPLLQRLTASTCFHVRHITDIWHRRVINAITKPTT